MTKHAPSGDNPLRKALDVPRWAARLCLPCWNLELDADAVR